MKPHIAQSDAEQEFCAHCRWWHQLDGNGGTTGYCDNLESRAYNHIFMAKHEIIGSCFTAKEMAKRGNEN